MIIVSQLVSGESTPGVCSQKSSCRPRNMVDQGTVCVVSQCSAFPTWHVRTQVLVLREGCRYFQRTRSVVQCSTRRAAPGIVLYLTRYGLLSIGLFFFNTLPANVHSEPIFGNIICGSCRGLLNAVDEDY